MHLNRILAPLGVAVLSAACGATPAISLADIALMPEVVMMQSVHVQEAYRFSTAHPEYLEPIPCYCGCSKINYRNNLECYLMPESRPDALVFDNHALACEICADITHLTMDLLEAGASPSAIRTAIDAQFAARGPGTDTPYPTSEHASASM